MTLFPRDLPSVAKAAALHLCLLGGLFAAGPAARGQSLLTNGDFSASDATTHLPNNWTPEPASASWVHVASPDPTSPGSGYAQVLEIDTQNAGTSSLGFVSQSLNVATSAAPLTPNNYYAARVRVRGTANGLAKLEVKRFSGSTEILPRIDSPASSTAWSRVQVGFDTFPVDDDDDPSTPSLPVTRIEVLLRYKKDATAAGQTVYFAGAELLDGTNSALGAITLVPTFESIGVYVPIDGAIIPGASGHSVELSYRTAGGATWLPALAPDPYTTENEFRGSVVLLQPNQSYEVQAVLKLNGVPIGVPQTATVSTWIETGTLDALGRVTTNIPVAAHSTSPLTITGGGTDENHWVRYQAAAGGSTIDVGTSSDNAVFINNAAYVIVDGLTIKGGKKKAVYISNSHHIRLINCDISGWSEAGTFGLNTTSSPEVKYGYFAAAPFTNATLINLRGGVYVQGANSTQVVIARNLIHNPVGKSSTWAFAGNTNHPAGPSGIVLDTTGGNNVVRDNDIIAGDGHRFNDVIEGSQNGATTGGPSLDTDISGNLLSASNDDGTELDGGQKNIRYWHNWIDGTHSQISTVPALQGPSYIFQNLFVGGDERGTTEDGFKLGGAPGVAHFINNTVYTENYAFSGGHSGGSFNTTIFTRNNLFTGPVVGNGLVKFDKAGSWSILGDIDYDLIPVNGINATDLAAKEPNRTEGYPDFSNADERSFLLMPGSAGIGAGVAVANITPSGVEHPDLGAVDPATASAAWPLRTGAPDVFPMRSVVRLRAGTTAVTSLQLLAPGATGGTWTAAAGEPWLLLSSRSGGTGEAAQAINCTVDASALAVGLHRTFVSFRTDTGALRTALVDVEVEPATDVVFSMEAEAGLPSGGFEAMADASASGGVYAHAYSGASGSIRQNFTVPADGNYWVHARVRGDGPSAQLQNQNSFNLHVDDATDLEWDIAGLGTDWSWDTAQVVPATVTADITGPIFLTAGAHFIEVKKLSFGIGLDVIVVSNSPFSPRVATPVFSPVGGNYTAAQTVTISSATPGATIRYTTDGSPPTRATGLIYTGPVTLDQTTLLRAVAFKDQMEDSRPLADKYSFGAQGGPVAAPVFSPAAGLYRAAQSVTMSSATGGATIRYTIDGSAPSETHGSVYGGPVDVGATTTLRAMAFADGLPDSAVTSGTYTLQPAAPSFSPAGGAYSSAQSVAIATTTNGATIRYTTDGSIPSETNGAIYAGPLNIAATTTLNAVATMTGWTDSVVTSAVYTISTPQVAAPTFSPAGGTYASAQSVTLATATAGATIRYTTDGSTPTETAGTIYAGAVSVSASATLKAIAYLAGMADSAVSSATYTINSGSGGGASFQMAGNVVAMEAEHFTSRTSSTDNWTVITDPNASGGAANNAVQSLPNDGTAYPAFNPTAASLGYAINVPAGSAANFYVHVRDFGATSSDDSIYVSLDGGSTTQVISAGRTLDWKSSPSSFALPAGFHTLTIWDREDGIELDKIVVSNSSTPPTGTGPAESAQSQAAAPVFSPDGGSYAGTQTVTITTATAGATIRYTTDGSAPSETSGTIYTTPLTIDATTTVNAIAYLDGISDSSISSATYTIDTGPMGPTAFMMTGNVVAMEAEHFSSQTAAGGKDWTPIHEDAASGSGNNAVQILPNTGGASLAPDVSTPHVDYLVNVPAGSAASFYVHLLDRGPSSTDDSVYISIDDSTTTFQQVTAFPTYVWKSTSAPFAIGAGLHTITIWMREDGAIVDKLAVTTSSTAPTGTGPAESPRQAVTAPVLTLPAGLTVEATGPTGAAVSFAASATDAFGNPLTPEVTPASGSTFPLGATTVNATVTDAAGNTLTASFTVTVADTTAPSLTLPANIVLDATSAAGATATFTTSAADLVDRAVPVAVSATSGSTFPIGATRVTASAHDAAGNSATGSFTVTVNPTAPAITTEPLAQTATVNDTVTLSAAVSGIPAPALQWQKDGADIPGATSASLTLASITTADAGAYTLVATNDAGTVASDATVLTVNKAVANVALDDASVVYDGLAHPLTATTVPAGLPVTLTYDGGSTPPIAAGSYTVVATVSDANYLGTATATLTIAKAPAAITLGDLVQNYDGMPKSVSVATTPAGLGFSVTYDGNPQPPTAPGAHAVVVAIVDPNYTGTATGTLTIGVTALVRHAPTINGTVDGSVQTLSGESFTLNGGAAVTGDVLVPGTPAVRLNGSPNYGGTLDGNGGDSPAGYQVTLNGGVALRHIVRRTDPVAMPVVAAPPAPSGSRDVVLNQTGQDAGDFATVRNLTLNGNVGAIAVPAGAYGNLTANGGSGFVLGVAGATGPAVYDLQALTLNGSAQLQIVGPVVLTLANGLTLNGTVGASAHPEWLTLRIASGGLTLNGNVVLAGNVVAPSGTITINGGSQLLGTTVSDRLVLNGNAELRQPSP